MRTATLAVALALLFPGISQAAPVERARYLMGTVCEVAAENPGQIELAFAEAKRIESMLSTWTGESELARVNRGEIAPGPELKALLEVTLQWAEKTNRAFDPRIGHLIGRTDVVGAIEEGAFGKGYALDRMLALIEGNALINFGGQILVRGAREVTIADPGRRSEPVLALTIENASLSTSAGSHILDPRLGTSVTRRGSASVIADDALTADMLSTALFVMGEDEGLRWARANGVAVIFIDANHHIRLSPKARERARGLAVIDRNFSIKE